MGKLKNIIRTNSSEILGGIRSGKGGFPEMEAAIKALIEGIIGEDEPKVWDAILEEVIGTNRKEEFWNVIEQKNKLRAEQRARLEEV